jgi:hypothetical protein
MGDDLARCYVNLLINAPVDGDTSGSVALLEGGVELDQGLVRHVAQN